MAFGIVYVFAVIADSIRQITRHRTTTREVVSNFRWTLLRALFLTLALFVATLFYSWMGWKTG
jgi:hypothetical protein